jgi:hypothetical protein
MSLEDSAQGGLPAWPASLMHRWSGSSAVEVAASAPAVRLGSELALQLHEAPDFRAVHADVGLDVSGQLLDGARSTPSSSAHRSSGAAIGRPRSGSCQVPNCNRGIEDLFETEPGILLTALPRPDRT